MPASDSWIPLLLLTGLGGFGAYSQAQTNRALEAALATVRLSAESATTRVAALEDWRAGRKSSRPLSVSPMTVGVGKNGHETCGEQGLVCVGVLPQEGFESRTARYWGWSTFDCGSRVVEARCDRSRWMTDEAEFSPDPTAGVRGRGDSTFCLDEPRLEGVLCADPASLAEPPRARALPAPFLDLSQVSARPRGRP